MIKIGDIVKVIGSIDITIPIEPKYLEKEGLVTEIHNDRPSPISVRFDGIGQDSFWPGELEIMDFLPGCDRDDCQYYKLGREFVEKCSECLENCQRIHLEGFDHFESK